jgi:hypothetical protein
VSPTPARSEASVATPYRHIALSTECECLIPEAVPVVIRCRSKEGPAARPQVTRDEPPLTPVGAPGGNLSRLPRRSFRDITADPAFAHDPLYRWLVGRLEKDSDGRWSLRYASLEEDDRYGGRLPLTASWPLTDFLIGQLVRVEGEVIVPIGGSAAPLYLVQAIHPQRVPSAH